MHMQFKSNTKFDVIALGRATVDLYAEQTGPLVKATSFAKYLGGSPGNTTVAMAKQGLKTGFIGKVSADGLGDFVRSYLKSKGIDVSQLHTDKTGHHTAITIGEILDGGKCTCLMYRDNCADLQLTPNDLDAEYINSAKALLISGASLARSPAREAVFTALRLARDVNTRIIFDPDFREGIWQEGMAPIYLLQGMLQADLVIATRDEMEIPFTPILGEHPAPQTMADYLLSRGVSMVNIKDGQSGSTVFTSEEVVQCPSYKVANVLKTFGAGDSYAAGFISGLLKGESIFDAQKRGSAAAAITITGRSCSDAAPTAQELQQFMQTHNL